MALDGVVLYALTQELNEKLSGARLNKIREPGKDELELTFRTDSGSLPLLVSANPSLPVILFSEEDRESPATAPNFCMAMRKHLLNARLLSVSQPGLERVVIFTFEHLDEMGDLAEKRLHVELMGKHSNIILVGADGNVIDAIRRVPPTVSSVRTILPGSSYFIPGEKKNAFEADRDTFFTKASAGTLSSYISGAYAGISESVIAEFLRSVTIDPSRDVSSLDEREKDAVFEAFSSFLSLIRERRFSFETAYRNDVPVAFSAFPLTSYHDPSERCRIVVSDSASEMLSHWYREKAETAYRKQLAENLERQVKTLLSRALKKQELQKKQLNETASRDLNRLYGELLYSYSHFLPVGVPFVEVENYYDNMKPVRIATDPALSIAENAKRYFDKYEKQKRTYEAVTRMLDETGEEIDYLSSVLLSLTMAEKPEDYREIREELAKAGHAKPVGSAKNKARKQKKSEPYRYRTSDGFLLLVGRNNLQNDELTMKTASPDDYFFHVKNAPGSHVILKTEGAEVPDRAYEEAASLAAYYSTKKNDQKVEVDYVLKKYVKKPAGAKPGYVIYHTNYSMVASPDISALTRLD